MTVAVGSCAPLGGPNFLAGLHLPLSLLLGGASTAWRWASERLVPFEGARATRGSKPGCSRRGRYSWGEGSVACAHDDGELGRDIRGGAEPGCVTYPVDGICYTALSLKGACGYAAGVIGLNGFCVFASAGFEIRAEAAYLTSAAERRITYPVDGICYREFDY